jgi:polysaccharide biosynthesis protein PslH
VPLSTGTKVRLYNIIKELRRCGHEVGLVAMIHRDELGHMAAIRHWFSDLVLVPVRRPNERFGLAREPMGQLLRRALGVLARCLKGLPLPLAMLYHPRIYDAVAELVPRYDHCFVEFFFMAQNLPVDASHRFREKLVLVEHDISFIPQMRRCQLASGWRRLVLWLNYIRYRRAEIATLQRFVQVVVMSELDRDIVQRVAPGQKVTVVPNGVDLAGLVFRGAVPRCGSPRLLFVGGLAHRPNFDGLRHFISEALPVLLHQFPDLTLTVVGDAAGAAPELMSLPRGDAVEFVGFVPDLNGHFAESTALIVPLRIAGGTRLKIIEAMAAGVPVITTAIGAEGLPVVHGEQVLVAETPQETVACVKRLVRDPEFAQRMAKAARRLCEEKYDWRSIVGAMEQQLLSSGVRLRGR